MPRAKMFDVEIKTAVTAEDYEALQNRARWEQVPVAQIVRSAIHDLLQHERETPPFPPTQEES